MATCFDDIIGIRTACTAIAGSSGLNIEDIGITTDECDSYINKDFKNGQELIESKIDFSIQQIKKLVGNHFASYINTKSLIDSKNLGDYQDSLQQKSGIANSYGGLSLTLNNKDSYFNVFVNTISLQVNVTQNVSVLVYDLISGALLDTIVVACTANTISTKIVNKTYESSKRKLDLIFVYDTTGINSNTTLLDSASCKVCNGYNYSNYFITASPVYLGTGDAKIRNSLENTTHTFGLSINYSVQCSLENWLCQIANMMALPILYKAGEEIMFYAVYASKRQNSSTNIDYERNKERLTAYQLAFNNAIEATIKKINIPKGDICFKCNEQQKMAIVLP